MERPAAVCPVGFPQLPGLQTCICGHEPLVVLHSDGRPDWHALTSFVQTIEPASVFGNISYASRSPVTIFEGGYFQGEFLGKVSLNTHLYEKILCRFVNGHIFLPLTTL